MAADRHLKLLEAGLSGTRHSPSDYSRYGFNAAIPGPRGGLLQTESERRSERARGIVISFMQLDVFTRGEGKIGE